MLYKDKKIGILMVLGIITFIPLVFNFEFNIVVNYNSGNVDIKNDINLDMAYADWEPYITRKVGDDPVHIFIGDADNDGDNDIVTANYLDNNVSILLWNGTDWAPQITREAGDHPYSVFIGDANNDGDNDIVTVNNFVSGNLDDNISILLWNGSDWDPQIIREAGDDPRGVFIGDADNDGDNDIVTANYLDNNVSILLWNGTDWESPITREVGEHPNDVYIGDADNDGDNDIITPNINNNTVSILQWNVTDWEPQITIDAGSFPGSICMGDADNDGDNDIVVTNQINNKISILPWNSSSASWDQLIEKNVGVLPWDIFIEDADNDGDNDIVVANTNEYEISIILWNATAGSWDDQIKRNVGSAPNGVGVGDVNNDGHNDIVLSLHNEDSVSILLGTTPSAPILYNILPSPDYNGIIKLNWSEVGGASKYYVYRSTSKMDSVAGLTPIATLTENNYIDTITTNGIYYYVIVAGNAVENSSISNRDCVTVTIPSGIIVLKVVEQVFTEDFFNLTFLATDDVDQNIENATIQAEWNNVDVPASSMSELGSGLYRLTLDPITVLPGDAPILLNLTISAVNYTDHHYQLYLAVDPATLNKGAPGDGAGAPGIPGYDVFILIGVFCIVSVILIRKRWK